MILYSCLLHTLFYYLESPMVIEHSECFFQLVRPEKFGGKILHRLLNPSLGVLFEPLGEISRLLSFYMVFLDLFKPCPKLAKVICLPLDGIKSDSSIPLIPL